MSQTRRLAAIMFTDIVGYTAMMQQNEAEGMAKAQSFRQTMQTQVETHHGELLEIRGDGSLSVFNSAVDAVACAKEIQETLREEVPLRIGIHLGDIVQKEGHIFGDAVNIASRIESMGLAGAVLISSNVRNQIKNKPEFELTSLGRFSFKNVEEEMSVYALANEGFAIPRRGQLKGKFSENPGTGWKKVLFLVLLIAIISGTTGIWWYQNKTTKSIKISERSIAVLPFRDLSQQQDQEYFCDGVAEEILDALSTLEHLKVAGRVSSFSFKNKPDISIAEIGEKLHVSTILNGSIRKQDKMIRVSVNLINVEDGFEIWSENYDLELKDILSIQEEIAQNIAKKFSLPSQNLIREKSNSPEAYEHYLKGKFFINKVIDGAFQARDEFEKAIQYDSTFLPAYTNLAFVYWTMGLYGLLAPPIAGEKIKEICEKALKINPYDGEAYHQLSTYEMYFNWNWEQAIEYA
ncbi:MAG: hypothetical protein KDE26_25425, partial [Bacteroidetes bacterium]|nr:hypothetical protein [Bacteroidota bacterium]